ncbi:MAG: type II secretion system F family protein [Pseudomonadota bacterium]
MFDPQTVSIAIGILSALSIAGIVYVVLAPLMDREEKKDRINKVAVLDRRALQAQKLAKEDAETRRKSIATKVKQQQDNIEERTKGANTSKAPLNVRLERAGLNWNVRQFWIFSAFSGLMFTLVVLMAGAPLFASFAAGVVGFLGFPQWYVAFKTKSRLKKFLLEYPNALDVVVRGMKAGLPLNDCMMIISREASYPVKDEFKKVVEHQQLGMQIHEAVGKMYERVPLPEVNFLAIMLTIQGQSGGNLSEPLANLSKVVRDRKKMKAKIDAMSMEAKSSAAIIACLPLAVIILVYLSTPDYIALLFTEQLGNVLLGACAILMLTGVMVMRKMINFDF